jgi:uncharacterized protein (TIGR03000 family)
MYHSTLLFAKVAVLAAALLFTTAAQSQAQHSGHSGGHAQAAHTNGYAGHFHAQASPYHYQGYRDGYHHYGYGGGGYGLGYYGGGGFGLGYYGGSYGSPYSGYSTPYYSSSLYPDYNNTYTAPTNTYQSFYPQSTDPNVQAPDHNTAMIDVTVAPNADLWFSGTKTKQTGSNRLFITPSLAQGQSYVYEVRASWMGQDGNPVTKTLQVRVQAGQRVQANFME